MRRFLGVLLLASSPCLATGINAWHDQDGHAVFGDEPPADVVSHTVTVRPNVYDSPSLEAAPAQLTASHDVVMYGTSWCKYCAKARAYFQSHDIAYTEYDVETSEKGRRDYAELGGHGVPVILVGSHRLNGFSPAAFEAMYAQN